MVFIGFGMLMCFLRRYSYSAVGLNFFSSCLVMVEAILVLGAIQQWSEGISGKVAIDLTLLIEAAFCAASAMIAFGAVLGKTTPTELLWLLFLMVPFYGLNQHLVFHTFSALDVGGSISIHAFGAYYGLAASRVLSRPGRQSCYGCTHPKNTSAYYSNILSMIGTLFLWVFWPSFNGALASVTAADATANQTPTIQAEDQAEANVQFLCVVNTVLSLAGSCLSTFATSACIHGKLDMVHMQNATLAGGVAMGSAASLRMTPGGALAVGVAAGVISTLGFAYLTPYLERRIQLGDTCGVHNLHGIPGILGGLVAGLAGLGQSGGARMLLPHAAGLQLGFQVAAIAATICIAMGSGAAGAALIAFAVPARERLDGHVLFDDGAFWTDEDIETVYPNASRPSESGWSKGETCPSANNSALSSDQLPPLLVVEQVPSVHVVRG